MGRAWRVWIVFIKNVPNVVIVVSSTWRLSHPLSMLRFMLTMHGLTGPVIDVTPDLNQGRCRGHEIQHWLDHSAPQLFEPWGRVESFVILDDDDDMANLLPRLVLTDPMVGLTDDDVDRAIDMLNTPI